MVSLSLPVSESIIELVEFLHPVFQDEVVADIRNQKGQKQRHQQVEREKPDKAADKQGQQGE
jgi:hypothetical protein